MKILVLGGTGLIGGHAAIHLQALGNEVSIAARNPPQQESPMAGMNLLIGDYVAGTLTYDDLAGFDALVFAAGNDIRHIPPGVDHNRHWEHANTEAIPRFVALARQAGVRKVVYVGSFYPQVAPGLIATNSYVRSRHLADAGVRALATPQFSVCSVNAPFVVGSVPGLDVPMFESYVQYAEGRMPSVPVFAPAGGSNFISTQSLSEAIWGALERGESGAAYLVGDENLTFQAYFQYFFRATGSDVLVPSLNQEHPLLPDAAIYTGRGNVVSYEPDPAEVALLAYRRHDVERSIVEIVKRIRGKVDR